jgi:hypothetical protein
MLLFSIPGAIVSFYVTKYINPVNSSMSSLVLMMVVTTTVAIVLHEPGQYVQAYLLSGAWGLTMGWNFTCDRMVISSIIPKHQEAEAHGGVFVCRTSLELVATLDLHVHE